MQSERDKKLLAFWDIKEQRQFAKELGVSIQQLRDAAMEAGHNGKPSRSIADIKIFIEKKKSQQQQAPSILPEDSDENAEVW